MEETKNYFVKDIYQNQLLSNKHRKFYTTLNYIWHFLILASVVTWCISASVFASLLIPIEITSFGIGVNIFQINAGIKKFKTKSHKKKKKHDKIVLWASKS